MNEQKAPFGRTINKWGTKLVSDHLQLVGKSLPCSVVSVDGAIITVNFEVSSGFTLPQIAVPLFGPEYIRYPIQAGDKGVVFSADARIGAMCGLSTGTADLSQPANLSALVFFPIGNKSWPTVDPESVTIYGQNGVVLRDTGSATTMTLTPSGIAIICENSFTISTGTCTFSMSSDGTYSLMGTTGTLQASTLNIEDAAHGTSPTIMHNAWASFVTYINTHVHISGNGGSPTAPPTVPFTGGSIAP